MGGFAKPQQAGTAQTPAQRLLSELFSQAVGGEFGGARQPGAPGRRRIAAVSPLSPPRLPPAGRPPAPGAFEGGPTSFEELIGAFTPEGQPFVAGPTELQRLAVGAGTRALGELEPAFEGLRELALTGGGLDPSGLRELERQAAELRTGFSQRGTRISRGAAAGEGLLRGETLAQLQGQALNRRLAASQLAGTLPFQAAGAAFGLGEGIRSIEDLDIARRLAEFADIRRTLLGGLGGTPIIGESPFGQLQGAAGTAATIYALTRIIPKLGGSDARLKHEIATIEDALDRVSRLRGVSFLWNVSKRPDGGVVAQEVEEEFPDFVDEHAGVKTVSYNALIGALIESVKELKTRVEALEADA